MKQKNGMCKNEIVARWMGFRTHPERSDWLLTPIGEDLKFKAFNYAISKLNYSLDRNWLHEAWVKFRDLKFDVWDKNDKKHREFCQYIEYCITRKPITEAFDELVKGIEWVNTLNKKV